MIRCDLCGAVASCLQKEIDGKEFDVCEPCWSSFAEKLSGKGRARKEHHEPGKDPAEGLPEYEEQVY